MRLNEPVDRPAERALERVARDAQVGRDEAEHRRHQGLDHPGPLGDAADRHRPPADLHPERGLLRMGVGRHDPLGGGAAALRGQPLHELGQRRPDLVHGQVAPDHARRGDEHPLRRDAEVLADDLRHLPRVANPLLARAHVRAPAGGDDRLGHAAPETLARDHHGRALDLVRREDAGGGRRGGGVHEGEVAGGRRLDAGMHAGGQDARNRGDAAVGPLEVAAAHHGLSKNEPGRSPGPSRGRLRGIRTTASRTGSACARPVARTSSAPSCAGRA